MTGSPKLCPGERELRAFVDGSLPDGDRPRIRLHVAACAACRGVVAGLDVTHKDPARPGEAAWTATETDPTVPLAGIPGSPMAGDLGWEEATEEGYLGILRPSDFPGSRGRLGQYEVLGILGQGGMGVVLKGFDPDLQRIVAIKILAPRLAASPRARRRFAREARAAAAINDAHVVTIHAVGDTGATPYLVMECIPGQTLQERIRNGPKLSILDILRITHQVAEGLEAAHRKAVIHRDIKPGNIMLVDSQARVKITDFGVALAAEGLGDATSADRMVGTPEYMSPEQMRGDAVDFRTDLFSMGCVIHAMVAGASPFKGVHLMDTFRRVLDQPAPALVDIDPTVPRGLSELTGRLLRKDPAERPASAQVVVEAVEALLARQPPPIDSVEEVRVVGPAKPARLAWGARLGMRSWSRRSLGVAAVGAALLAASLWMTRTPRRSDDAPFPRMPDRVTASEDQAERPAARPGPVVTVSRLRPADFSSLALAIARVSEPGTTVRILDGEEYGGPIILKGSTRHQGLTIEAAGPGRPVLTAPGSKNAVFTVGGIPGLTLRGVTLKSRAEQFALSIFGFNPGLVLEDLDLAKGEPAPDVGFWSHAWLGNGARGEPRAPIVFDRCRFGPWPTGLAIQGHAGEPISHVVVRGCRFEARLRQLELIAPVRDVEVVNNLFLDGSSAVILDKLAGDSGDIVVANNTFWRVRRWLDPIDVAANLPGMSVFNNALLESGMPTELGQLLAGMAGAGWSFHHNVAEGAGIAGTQVIELVPEIEVESRDAAGGGSEFLRPAPNSILARRGAKGSAPAYVGALEPADRSSTSGRSAPP